MACVVSVFAVEPFRIGGTEAFAKELSVQLAAQGWQSVLCFLTEPSREVRRFLDLPNVTLEVLPGADKLSWKALSNLGQVLRKYEPEILHLHFIGFLGLYPWLSWLHSVGAVFFTDHSSRPSGYQAKRSPLWKRAVVRAVNRPIVKVICVSQYGLACMRALGVLPDDRYQLIYNGVDIPRICPDPARGRGFRQRFSIPEERAVVLQVSWIIPEKGIGDLLQVARTVVARNDKVQFVFVGEGLYREQYMKAAEAMGLADHVTWTGLVEDPLGEGVYDAADVVCQLSNWEEVFGWMIAEAMVSGKPVVATRVGGIPELVQHGESGFLVDRGDAAATAEHILQLLSNRGLRRKMGAAGRRLACSKFDLETNVRQLLRVYDLR